MAIDPDIQPILDDITARIGALEAATPEAPDLTAALARLTALELRTAGAAAALSGGVTIPVTPDTPGIDLPAGYRRVGDFIRARGDAANWGVDELIMTTWQGGAGTMGDPSLIEWGSDGSAMLRFVDGTPPRSGVLQLNKPAKATGRWGAILEVIKPDAVCAFFTYASNGREFDFELIRVNGVAQWAIGVHMPKTSGLVSSQKIFAPLQDGAHKFEMEYSASAVTFWIDDVQVAQFTAADVTGAIWETEATMQTFCSVEKHGAWAGQTYADGTASMRVHALLA